MAEQNVPEPSDHNVCPVQLCSSIRAGLPHVTPITGRKPWLLCDMCNNRDKVTENYLLNSYTLLRTSCQNPLNAKLQNLILDDHQSPTGFKPDLFACEVITAKQVSRKVDNNQHDSWPIQCTMVHYVSHNLIGALPGKPPVDPQAVHFQVAQRSNFARPRRFPPPPQWASWPSPAANLGQGFQSDPVGVFAISSTQHIQSHTHITIQTT